MARSVSKPTAVKWSTAASESRKRSRMFKRFTPILLLTATCWVVLLINQLILNGHLNQFGITPRHLGGLPGILWAPFLHASFEHLAANTLPLLVLGAILCARGGGEVTVATIFGILLTGGFTWILGRNATHI